MSQQSLSDMVAKVDEQFDQIVREGSDDELFASGYLRGHFDLVVAHFQTTEEESPEKFWLALQDNVKQSASELNHADRILVDSMIDYLKAQVK